MQYEIGKWSQELFDQFHATPAGPKKRILLDRLMVVNEPLAKIIASQLCGFGEPTRRKGFRAMGGCQGFRDLPIDDALQAARIALCKALEQFDPGKGKFAPYVKLKMRHELQRLVYYGGSLVRVPRGEEDRAVPVVLMSEEDELARSAGGIEDGIAALEGITPEDVARWEETGEWPESPDEIRKPDVVRIEIPKIAVETSFETIASRLFVFHPNGRTETWWAHNLYRVACRRGGIEEMPRPHFVEKLGRLGPVRETTLRTSPGASPVRALAGLRLQSSLPKCA